MDDKSSLNPLCKSIVDGDSFFLLLSPSLFERRLRLRLRRRGEERRRRPEREEGRGEEGTIARDGRERNNSSPRERASVALKGLFTSGERSHISLPPPRPRDGESASSCVPTRPATRAAASSRGQARACSVYQAQKVERDRERALLESRRARARIFLAPAAHNLFGPRHLSIFVNFRARANARGRGAVILGREESSFGRQPIGDTTTPSSPPSRPSKTSSPTVFRRLRRTSQPRRRRRRRRTGGRARA